VWVVAAARSFFFRFDFFSFSRGLLPLPALLPGREGDSGAGGGEGDSSDAESELLPAPPAAVAGVPTMLPRGDDAREDAVVVVHSLDAVVAVVRAGNVMLHRFGWPGYSTLLTCDRTGANSFAARESRMRGGSR